MPPPPPSDRELVTSLAGQLRESLARLIGRDSRVALVDFPYSPNSGDSAIWRGERAVLAELGTHVAYTCATDSYRPGRLRERIGVDDVILCHGGGNFGDYWPEHQDFREQLLRDFPNQKIIQLPQSVGFREKGSAERIKKQMQWHSDFHVLCRDELSLGRVDDELGLRASLVPDAAFGIGPLDRPFMSTRDILVLARSDHERAFDLSGIDLPGAVVEDWTLTSREFRTWKTAKIAPKIARRFHDSSLVDRVTTPPRGRAYEFMASLLVEAAVRQLSTYRVVVTDRLHAHVLCVLLGIPHVVLDNNYGKIRGLHDAWLRESTTTVFASSLEEAGEFAAGMLTDDDH